MATAHTPGPWMFTEGDREKRSQSMIAKADDPEFHIAQAVCEFRNEAQRAEDIANARLLAASPELLTACQNVLAWATRECLPQGGKSDGPWELIEAAISKAVG